MSAGYDLAWVMGLDMGPHPLWQLEDLLPDLALRPGDRVLDLGCGRGATSVFLARECGAVVVALDLWVDPVNLRLTLTRAGVGDRVTAVRADARVLPFAPETFDAVVGIDCFEYFGTDVHLLPSLLRVLRPGGRLAVSTPALRTDPYEEPPPPHVRAVVGWEAAAWHSPAWWATHWELTGLLEDVRARMQPGGREDWLEWSLATGGPEDPVTRMLEADTEDQIGFALVSARRRAVPDPYGPGQPAH